MPRKKPLPNHNKPWLAEVEQELAADHKNGASLTELAKHMAAPKRPFWPGCKKWAPWAMTRTRWRWIIEKG